jgi:hypothetical protein
MQQVGGWRSGKTKKYAYPAVSQSSKHFRWKICPHIVEYMLFSADLSLEKQMMHSIFKKKIYYDCLKEIVL